MVKKLSVFLFLALIAGASCSVKKRNYRNGFYVDWAFAKKSENVSQQKRAVSSRAASTDSPLPEKTYASAIQDPDEFETASLFPLEKYNTQDDPCGDTIFFRKGTVTVAKVLEINDQQIKYKRCDNLQGPTIIVNKNDIERIHYINGVADKFEIKVADPVNTQGSGPKKEPAREVPQSAKKVHPLAWLGLLFTAASIVVPLFLIAAFVVFPIAERNISKQPHIYKGARLVSICRSICKVWSFIWLFLFILFVASQ